MVGEVKPAVTEPWRAAARAGARRAGARAAPRTGWGPAMRGTGTTCGRAAAPRLRAAADLHTLYTPRYGSSLDNLVIGCRSENFFTK